MGVCAKLSQEMVLHTNERERNSRPSREPSRCYTSRNDILHHAGAAEIPSVLVVDEANCILTIYNHGVLLAPGFRAKSGHNEF